MAGTFLYAFPVMVFYFLLGRYLIRGYLAGRLKLKNDVSFLKRAFFVGPLYKTAKYTLPATFYLLNSPAISQSASSSSALRSRRAVRSDLNSSGEPICCSAVSEDVVSGNM